MAAMSSAEQGAAEDTVDVPVPDVVQALLTSFVPNPDGLKHLRRVKHGSATTLQDVVGRPQTKSPRRLGAYLGRRVTRSLDMDAAVGRRPPMPWDGTHMMMEHHMQDLMAECGMRQSLKTNIMDLGPHCNTNILRFKRQPAIDKDNDVIVDGGWQYSTALTCMGNWVEERADATYQGSGFHAKELGLSKLYNTEHLEHFKPLSEEFKTKHAVAKFPKPKQTLRANDSNAQRFLYYAGGFGESAALDHTSPTKRGGYWLGTAPYKQHESVTSTATRHEPLEFQRRCPNLDPKARILEGVKPLDLTDRNTQRVMRNLQASQQHAAAWHTSYHADFQDRSRCAMTLPARDAPVQLPDIQARPNSNA